MRILIATDSFPPKIDGVADTAAVLCRTLTERGHHVTVIAPGPGSTREHGAHVVRLSSLPLPFYPEVRATTQLRTLRQLVKRLDTHAAIVLTLGPIGIGAARWLPRETALVHVYTTDMPAYLRAYGLGLLAPLAYRITRAIGRRAVATLCPTPFVRDTLAAARVPGLLLWGRGVDTSLFHPGRRSAAVRARLTNGEPARPLVLYAGRLAKEKRLLDLLEATRQLPHVRFAFVGDGPQRAQLERVFPHERTVFTGYLRGISLAEAFASADLFAFPSDSDTFAQVVLQAMASGVPPIVVAGSAPASMVEHGVSGLHVAPRSGAAIAEALSVLVSQHEYRNTLARNAVQAAAARNWEALVDRMERLLSGEAVTNAMEAHLASPAAAESDSHIAN